MNGSAQRGPSSQDGGARLANGGPTRGRAMSRAEQFEDEKRRIIESCFSKKDEKGSVVESYITHIRVTEDAAHPSSPPPLDSAEDNKKFRAIIVAVRSSGRVRMHKARENANLTFSVGKTWNLDDLSRIQIFGVVPSASREEETLNQRAGKSGFVVTVQKPYYWLAGSPKEKEFFIGSLVKIYKKYTGGHVPELVGFDPKEREQLIGPAGAAPKGPIPVPRDNTPPAVVQRPRDASTPASSRPTPSPGPPPQHRRLSPSPGPPPPLSQPRVRSPGPGPPPGSRGRTSPTHMTPPPSRGSPARRPPPSRSEASATPEPLVGRSSRQREESREATGARPSQDQHHRPRTPASRPRTPEHRPPSPKLTNGPSTNKQPTAPPPLPPSEPTKDIEPAPPPPVPPEEPVESQEENFRPGLGPMIKKKSRPDVASAFRKAATAYNAFKPRVGGAGERLLGQPEKTSNEPDGITGVVPAPSLLRGTSEDSKRSGTPTQIQQESPATPIKSPTSEKAPVLPEVKITSSPLQPGVEVPRPLKPVEEPKSDPTPEKIQTKSPKLQATKRQRRRSGQTARYATALSIDPKLLNERILDFDLLLDEFGWGQSTNMDKNVEELEAEIRRELGRVEAGSWLGHLEQKDDRVGAVERMLDKAVAECEELDGLLTLYSVELSTLNEDIAYIEAQSQGLQVQTANQRLLQTELESLLQTISISSKQLQSLKEASLETPAGLEEVERSLSILFRAMITIDPSIRQHSSLDEPRSSEDALGSGHGNELGSMRALQEKKEGYRNESLVFLQRLRQYMNIKFQAAAMESSKQSERRRNRASAKSDSRLGLDPSVHDATRNEIWRFSPIMFFAREIDTMEWSEMMKLYEKPMKLVYQEEFREDIFSWKRAARTTTGEEQDLLFTAPEKDNENLASAARKLTVKRSQTLARGFRSERSDSTGSSRPHKDKSQSGKLHAFEVFAAILDDVTPLMFYEQNFIVAFFHLSTVQQFDFADAVASTPPEARMGTDLARRMVGDPDRQMANRVMDIMDQIYGFWPSELQNLVDWAIKSDALQGVGVMFSLERKLAELEDTNQEFLLKTFSKTHDRLTGLFARFVDEQLRAIEDTKVKIKKRKGVIGFMKTFPPFSMAIENMLSEARTEEFEIRTLMNDTYARINKAMFESLRAIAKESPAATMTVGQSLHGQNPGNDPEDKEALNYHILLIENMNHYIEEVDSRDNPILNEWRSNAANEMAEHMDLYLDAVIRRPLGKTLDFVETTESILTGITNPPDLATRTTHSRSVIKKLLAANDTRELKRGADTLRKRVEKHFGDADDPGLSRALVLKILRACASRYEDIGSRLRRIVDLVYPSDVQAGSIEWDWRPEEIAAVLQR